MRILAMRHQAIKIWRMRQSRGVALLGVAQAPSIQNTKYHGFGHDKLLFCAPLFT
jgi:hypothetical protein